MTPLLKYCGNKSSEDLAVTTSSKADYLGFVFVPGTKRYVEPKKVNTWLEKNRINPKKLVALFVNESPHMIEEICTLLPIDVIQCHGTESPTFVTNIKQKTGKEVWKVIHHHPEAISQMQTFNGIADGYIVDTKVAGSLGGTGQTFDWEQIPGYIKEGKRQSVPVFIAGGVDATNIARLASYSPDGIDLSSGIEVNGHKSPESIRELEKELLRHDHTLS
ncbi:phosphoribosylanthranilate isomerase [Alkalicoccobacillus plakortidis]|uniref:N-(5'-phosphoribosyl)anthranilate isomerase n=1 Tax=Alkalicoccobacillus plakortidis TaxID=444060 RepID=A0ABT0XEP0_9BACI|nr:phosphoribosylanthranilate isomerase [Alkalicoccobacillus plakortidis]MCM2674342.1 phosphoribosylanthranilate isomerase [Alkalicoccobacillus plakortidis]